MGQTKSDDIYDIVRRADGAVVDTLIIAINCRILITRYQNMLGHRNVSHDEHVLSRPTLSEMVKEMTAKN